MERILVSLGTILVMWLIINAAKAIFSGITIEKEGKKTPSNKKVVKTSNKKNV